MLIFCMAVPRRVQDLLSLVSLESLLLNQAVQPERRIHEISNVISDAEKVCMGAKRRSGLTCPQITVNWRDDRQILDRVYEPTA